MTNWKPIEEAKGALIAKRPTWPNLMRIGSTYHVSRYHTGDFIGQVLRIDLLLVEMKVIAVFTGNLQTGDTVICDGKFAAFHVAKQEAT